MKHTNKERHLKQCYNQDYKPRFYSGQEGLGQLGQLGQLQAGGHGSLEGEVGQQRGLDLGQRLKNVVQRLLVLREGDRPPAPGVSRLGCGVAAVRGVVAV